MRTFKTLGFLLFVLTLLGQPQTLFGQDLDIEVQEQALFALSQMGGEESIILLIDVAQNHPQKELREKAIFWLGQEGGQNVLAALEQIARNDPDPDVQKQVIFAYSQLPHGEGVPRLIDIARTHENADVREKAIFWLGQEGGEDVLEFFDELLAATTDSDLMEQIVFAFSQLPDSQGVPRLINVARNHSSLEVRKEAIFWLGQTNDPRAAETLLDIVHGN